MQWLDKIVEQVVARHPEGEILVSSGVSPSGKYHVGTLREVLTADAIMLGLRKKGRKARHIHVVDDLDALRKIPAGLPEEFSKYLGQPLCDVPSPEGKDESYADYYLNDFLANTEKLGMDVEVMRSHEKYRHGFFTEAIELVLDNLDKAKKILEEISGRRLGEEWSPVQVNEDGYLKKRQFVSMDKEAKTIAYLDKDSQKQTIPYSGGQVKLDWRLDWPARWWLLHVDVEPFGRDHAAKGSSYDTGQELMKEVFKAPPPLPVPYEFINRAGETKKMSKSAGNTVTISELLEVLPPEIVRFFVLRYSPDKQLYFDQTDGVIRLIDEYAELLAKPDKSKEDEMLIEISAGPIAGNTISNVPFSHLVASYQASLKDMDKTLDVIRRTEHGVSVDSQAELIKKELAYINKWLDKWAPDDVKFQLKRTAPSEYSFTEEDLKFFKALADKIEEAPTDADGEWFHKAIYSFKDEDALTPIRLFSALYMLLIGKTSGPRAGWFLSILPREWLIKRLRLEQ